MVQSTTTINPATAASLGTGTFSDPFQVSDETLLKKVGTGEDGWTLSAYYVLTEDITLPGVPPAESNWVPIGDETNQFTGSFDGDGHTITGLTINEPTESYLGLFGCLGSGGTVVNVGLVDGSVTGYFHVGGVAGRSNGVIANCYNTGEMTGTEYVGGMVGTSINGRISNCYNTGNIYGGNSVGGMVGTGSDTVTENCYNTGNITSLSYSYTGGIVGSLSLVSADCSISNCYNTGDITGEVAGGIVGSLGISPGLGGIVEYCYSTGKIIGGSPVIVGGIVGLNHKGKVQYCVALNESVEDGSVVGMDSTVGRVAGENYDGILENNYARNSMLLPAGSVTDATANGKDGAGLTDAALITEEVWTTAGFDFDSGPWRWTDWQLPHLFTYDAQVWPDYLNLTRYTVTFKDWDGTVLKTQSVIRGQAATPPDEPTRPGFSFGYWNPAFSNVTSNLTVTAQYDQVVYLVSVIFKDWDGTILDAQYGIAGMAATAPDDPVRPGFTFIGWDADFSVVLDSLVVNALYEQEQTPDTVLQGIDTYKFVNSTDAFFGDSIIDIGFIMIVPGSGTYKVTGEYYDNLLAAAGTLDGRPLSNADTWKQYVLNYMNKAWNGSCFGMSSVLSLTKANRLTPGFFQPGAEKLFDLDYPRDSVTITNLINYYQLMQYTPTTETRLRDKTDDSLVQEYIVEALQDSELPVLIAFSIYNDAAFTSLKGNHAVVGYDVRETGSAYEVSVWDPNYLTAPSNKLLISKDYSAASFSGTYPYTQIFSVMTIADNYYDYKNIQKVLEQMGVSSLQNGVSPYALPVAATSLITNYASFSITSSTGESATVIDGVKTSGTLDLGDAEPLNEIAGELELRFAVPNLAPGMSYTVTPIGSSPGTDYQTALFCNDEQTGYYTRIVSEESGDFKFGADGSVSALLSQPAEITLAATLAGSGQILYTITATGTDKYMEIAPTPEGMLVTTEDDQVNISASGDYNSVMFADIDASDGVIVTETVDRYVSVRDNANEEIARESIGYRISFNSMGGTPVEAITNITPDTKVVAPANPVRPGYDFAGWYTDEAYSTIWDFSANVTGDLSLYADWTPTGGNNGGDGDSDDDSDGDSDSDSENGSGSGSSSGGGGGGTTGGNTGSPLTILAGDGTVPINYTLAGGTATLVLPNSKTTEIISKIKESKVAFDLSKAHGITAVEMSKTALTQMAGAKLSMELKLPWGTLSMSADMLKSVAEQATGAQVTFELKQLKTSDLNTAQKNVVRGSDVIVALNLYSGAQKITEFDGVLTVTVPYNGPVPAVVWYLKDTGEVEKLICVYDPATKTVTFTINHLSLYLIGQENEAVEKLDTDAGKTFADVKAGDWFWSPVNWVCEKGVMTGTSTEPLLFSPNNPLTRGMVATVLYRMEGSPGVSGLANPFDDVTGGQWYTNAVIWAVNNGIVAGYGEGKYGPDDNITREQMATLLYNYRQWKGFDLTVGLETNILSYTDALTVSEWAIPALQWACGSGIISGKPGNLLDPLGQATRAEFAAVLMRLAETA